ncbi:unnamed protein product [Boreogadus saida]
MLSAHNAFTRPSPCGGTSGGKEIRGEGNKAPNHRALIRTEGGAPLLRHPAAGGGAAHRETEGETGRSRRAEADVINVDGGSPARYPRRRCSLQPFAARVTSVLSYCNAAPGQQSQLNSLQRWRTPQLCPAAPPQVSFNPTPSHSSFGSSSFSPASSTIFLFVALLYTLSFSGSVPLFRSEDPTVVFPSIVHFVSQSDAVEAPGAFLHPLTDCHSITPDGHLNNMRPFLG